MIFKKDKKLEEQRILIKKLYRQMTALSNMDEKTFIKMLLGFLREYEILKFIDDDNIMFKPDKYGKWKMLTKKEKIKLFSQK